MFLSLGYESEVIMGYLSIRETAEKWGISVRRVQILCSTDRIPGAMKVGSFWVIPKDAEKPKDERIKNGKYIKDNKLKDCCIRE